MLAADTDPSSLAGLDVVDRRGERIGRVRQVYRDPGGLGWVGVRGNLLGTEEVLVPLEGAVLEADVIGVPVSRSRFRSAPRRRSDAALDDPERGLLHRFWSEPEDADPFAPTPMPARATEEAGSEGDVLTASEERLRIETERVPRSRVRLRKVVVTEEQTVTVPVRREEYRLVREPIEDADPVVGGTMEAAEQVVVLHEERVVVTVEVVPVERVRLVKEEVVESREVVRTVRRERIEVEDDDPAPVAQPVAPAIATKRSTSSRSPRNEGSTPARSSTSAAATAPPSTGASD